MRIAVIIPAAGTSSRFGSGRSKLDEDLGGRPVLHRTIDLFDKRDEVGFIVVAGPHASYEEFLLRHGDKLGLLGVKVCRGGVEHRWQSVQNALAMVPEDCTHVAVHDAARPCAPSEMIDRVFEAARKHAAVIPAVEIPDTLKRVSIREAEDRDIDPLDAILGSAGRNTRTRTVEETISRENLVQAQTPQVFDAALLRRAYAQANLESTDDAGLVERLGQAVVVVEGDPRNIKITRQTDLPLARQILGLKGPTERPVHKRF